MPKDIDVCPVFTSGELTFSPIPLFIYQSDLGDELNQGLSADDALGLYDCMVLIRALEEMVIRLKTGKFEPLPGYKYYGAAQVCVGQEAVATGAMSAIRPDDFITSTHRGHGHHIAKVVYALRAASAAELREFLGREAGTESRKELEELALRQHLNRTMAELLGKEEGYCRGRAGGMHIADFQLGHLGANAIVGGSYAIATGAAMACQKLATDRLTLCLVGDGATNNGIAHESYNFATMAQFESGTPVIYLIENNHYGMTGQQQGEVTGLKYLARRGAGYNDFNMHAEVVNGMDVLAVRDAVSRAAKVCRGGEGPVMLECHTYRYSGHSVRESDNRESYRSKEEEGMWLECDPIKHFRAQLLEHDLCTEDDLKAREDQASQRIREATSFAANATDPDPGTIHEGLFAETTSDRVDPKWATPEAELLKKPRKRAGEDVRQILVRHAINEGLIEEMLRDRRVVLYGEDIADYGGAFGVTRGILEIFGRGRIFNTAISEAAIVGTGVGAAMVGMRPVVEIMYIDFMLMAMDQVANQAAKNRYMLGGNARTPLVIRTSIGGGRGYAGQHSQSLEAIVTMFPGLKVVAPATAYDAKGLIKSAIRDDNPVVYIEHQHVLTERGEVPGEEYTVPIGVARVAREGTDCTVVAYSWLYYRAMEAAKYLAEEGISVEVIDPRTLVPLDIDTIAKSVHKTGHLVVVQQASERGCFGEHIAYQIQRWAFANLKAPIAIVAAHNVPPPMAAPLEEENIPSVQKIMDQIRVTI